MKTLSTNLNVRTLVFSALLVFSSITNLHSAISSPTYPSEKSKSETSSNELTTECALCGVGIGGSLSCMVDCNIGLPVPKNTATDK